MSKKKKKEKTSFWTVVFWNDEYVAEEDIELLPIGETIAGKYSTAEKRAKRHLKYLNGVMLHPEDETWRFKIIELADGRKE
jgi:hypothetical protein